MGLFYRLFFVVCPIVIPGLSETIWYIVVSKLFFFDFSALLQELMYRILTTVIFFQVGCMNKSRYQMIATKCNVCGIQHFGESKGTQIIPSFNFEVCGYSPKYRQIFFSCNALDDHQVVATQVFSIFATIPGEMIQFDERSIFFKRG